MMTIAHSLMRQAHVACVLSNINNLLTGYLSESEYLFQALVPQVEIETASVTFLFFNFTILICYWICS